MRLDINEWLRRERDWRDLYDLIDQLPFGSHYQAAKLHDPDLIEEMARKKDSDEVTPPALEDFDSLRMSFARVEDLLWKILYATARSDQEPPSAPRPVMPWVKVRDELGSEDIMVLKMGLVPWEVEQ